MDMQLAPNQGNGLFTMDVGECRVFMGARYESTHPVAYRLCQCEQRSWLQGLYRWQQGANGGEEWRDLPTMEFGASFPGEVEIEHAGELQG